MGFSSLSCLAARRVSHGVRRHLRTYGRRGNGGAALAGFCDGRGWNSFGHLALALLSLSRARLSLVFPSGRRRAIRPGSDAATVRLWGSLGRGREPLCPWLALLGD